MAAERALAAVAAGDADELRELIEADPALADARADDGVSLLLKAQYMQRDDLVAIVRAAHGDLDVHEAAALGDTDRLRELLDAEPQLADAQASDGFAPLHLAAFFERPDAVRLLLERGADATAVAANPMRVTPLHSAAASGGREAARLLLEAGADPNAEQRGGYTAMDAAAATGDAQLAELLREHGG